MPRNWRCSAGSSPLARGTQGERLSAIGPERFIPAGAGNTQGALCAPHPRPVHPRWRGEHSLAASSIACSSGSSPLARGTRAQLILGAAHGRFIPAGAGNTRMCAWWFRWSPVHPRWRGEHSFSFSVAPPGYGSSPLARGTLEGIAAATAAGRFIPAGAGNTARSASSSRSKAVHPRWRGEHQGGNAGLG